MKPKKKLFKIQCEMYLLELNLNFAFSIHYLHMYLQICYIINILKSFFIHASFRLFRYQLLGFGPKNTLFCFILSTYFR